MKEIVYTDKMGCEDMQLGYLKRISEALERSADLSARQLESYNKAQHETYVVMAKREERDLEQVERIKERHQWDKNLHEVMMRTEKIKLEREEFWKEETIQQMKDKDRIVKP